ncbi:MAG: fimbrillin family protein, partial [Muribaculaceae bacterium]|nr:fimbrillin family protein [Muribaculaceae bacterium]
MIKLTYLTPAVMLLLSSCSQEEQIKEPDTGNGDRIFFRTSLAEVSSRAEVANTGNINEIHVTAFNPY